jgi:hypothetical protein
MFKNFMIVMLLLLHVIMAVEINVKGDFELTEWKEFQTDFDDAMGNCKERPVRKTKWFVGKSPVSLLRYKINFFQALCY